MTIEINNTKFTVEFSFFAVVTIMLLIAESEIVAVCLVSSLLHECGHLAFMFAFGQNPPRVIFGAFGIRIDRNETSVLSYKKEAVIALGGVMVNAVLSAMFLASYLIWSGKTAFAGIFVNLFIAALNLMPVGILDAGNFLRYILLISFDEEKTAKILLRVSDITACALCAVCVFYTIFVSLNISFIIVCVYVITVNLKQR